MILVAAFGLLILGLLFTLAWVMVSTARDIWRLWPPMSDAARQRRLQATARLTTEEAAALALAAIDDRFYAHTLYATLEEQGGALVWRMASATFDMGVTATVDDASGAVRDVHHWSAWPRR